MLTDDRHLIDRLVPHHPQPGARPTRTELTAYVGLLASVGSAAVFTTGWHWVTLAGALMLIGAAPGAGIMCWIDSGEAAAQAGLTLVLSLATTAVASAVMIWLAAWHPRALVALAGASLISCLLRLAIGRRT